MDRKKVEETIRFWFGDQNVEVALNCLEAIEAESANDIAPTAIIHVDGSFMHVEWRVKPPAQCHMPVYASAVDLAQTANVQTPMGHWRPILSAPNFGRRSLNALLASLERGPKDSGE